MKKKLNCILLVDDDEPTNNFNQMILEDVEITDRVVAIQSAEEALDYLLHKGKYTINGTKYPLPELLFLDINMPSMNGWEFLDEYKKLPQERKSKVVVVMLTASPNPDDESRAKSIAEVAGFFNKPLLPKVVDSIMEAHFQSRA